jgi:hypothetical protein
MEIKEPIFKRVPPGDRWSAVGGEGTQIFPSLTDALEYYFQKTKSREYYINAGAGMIYSVREEPDPEPEIQHFSIYGDY